MHLLAAQWKLSHIVCLTLKHQMTWYYRSVLSEHLTELQEEVGLCRHYKLKVSFILNHRSHGLWPRNLLICLWFGLQHWHERLQSQLLKCVCGFLNNPSWKGSNCINTAPKIWILTDTEKHQSRSVAGLWRGKEVYKGHGFCYKMKSDWRQQIQESELNLDSVLHRVLKTVKYWTSWIIIWTIFII